MTARANGATTDDKLLAAARHLEAHVGEPVTLDHLATVVDLSPTYLQRSFSHRFGMSPRRYHSALRVDALKTRLRRGESVADAGFGAGFGSSRGLYEHASRGLGMPPGAYRKGGAGLSIGYTVVDSMLGSILVGATERGVCAVLLGGGSASLEAALADEFPRATLARDDTALRDWAASVVARAAGDALAAPVPLDLQGTAFQRRVWAALTAIPAGTTASYASVAQTIGAPSSVRAVAGACARNHATLVVPCHRVIRTDGGLGGYRWGVARKRLILQSEGALPPAE